MNYHRSVSASGYVFGPFRVELHSRRLLSGTEAVPLGSRHFDVLVALVSQAGQVVPKNTLVEAGWQDVAVTENSLEQAISLLRLVLGAMSSGEPYIRTVPRRGYTFAGAVEPLRVSEEGLDAVLEPHRAWLEGRVALETLDRGKTGLALKAFERAIEAAPHDAALHVGLANACAWQFEATRADDRPAVDALERALQHAREACRLNVQYGEAWATLGFVLHRAGQATEALAAARRAVALEPSSWRHHIRLAFVSWGEERLRAADRARQLLPGLALAHWLAATVHVARQAFDIADRELDVGSAAQDAQDAAAPFGAVGLHWLRGLVRLERGDTDAARESFERELTFETSGHLYTRECCANAWHAIGALFLRDGRVDEAARAFHEALARIPSHASAIAALSHIRDAHMPAGRFEEAVASLEQRGAGADATVARATWLSLEGQSADAARIVHQLVIAAAPGNAAWVVPVDPILRVGGQAEWASALTLLRARAS
jgi:DNA-binding winged helix-turn-helix (wHTH) protein/Tfp pilus assembly protein PilF